MLPVLMILMALGAVSTTRQVGSIFTMPELNDEYDRRGYTKQELDALEYLEEYRMSRSFLALLVPPECDFEDWMYPSCCGTIELLDEPHELCIDMAMEWRELKISLSLNHNGDVLFTYEFILGEICAGIPYFNKIAICGHLYHIDYQNTTVGLTNTLFFQACLTIKIKLIVSPLEVRFYCLDAIRTKYADNDASWDLRRNTTVDPSEPSMIAILLKKDKIAIEYNVQIPPELVQAMKDFANGAVEVIDHTVLVVKDAIVNTYNTVATAAGNAWKSVKCLFSC